MGHNSKVGTKIVSLRKKSGTEKITAARQQNVFILFRSEVALGQLLPFPLRLDNHVANFSYRPPTAASGSDIMHKRQHLGISIGRSSSKTDPFQNRDINQVISDESRFFFRKTCFREYPVKRGQLVQ